MSIWISADAIEAYDTDHVRPAAPNAVVGVAWSDIPACIRITADGAHEASVMVTPANARRLAALLVEGADRMEKHCHEIRT